jgi:hypothetical protein
MSYFNKLKREMTPEELQKWRRSTLCAHTVSQLVRNNAHQVLQQETPILCEVFQQALDHGAEECKGDVD